VSRNPLSLAFGRGKGLVTREGVTYRGVSIERDRKGYPSVLRLRRGRGQEVSTRSRLRQGWGPVAKRNLHALALGRGRGGVTALPRRRVGAREMSLHRTGEESSPSRF